MVLPHKSVSNVSLTMHSMLSWLQDSYVISQIKYISSIIFTFVHTFKNCNVRSTDKNIDIWLEYKWKQSVIIFTCYQQKTNNQSIYLKQTIRVSRVPYFSPEFVWFCFVWFMVFNANFNNISVISWWSVLLVEETGIPWENHQPVPRHWQTLFGPVINNTNTR